MAEGGARAASHRSIVQSMDADRVARRARGSFTAPINDEIGDGGAEHSSAVFHHDVAGAHVAAVPGQSFEEPYDGGAAVMRSNEPEFACARAIAADAHGKGRAAVARL